MSRTYAVSRRWIPLVLLALVALVSLLAAQLMFGARGADAEGAQAPAAAPAMPAHQHGAFTTPHNEAQVAFHDQMRKLWEDHVT
ncbi:MAG: hypothetical protein ACRDVZ_05995, partial [Jiangellaceae bacterium]